MVGLSKISVMQFAAIRFGNKEMESVNKYRTLERVFESARFHCPEIELICLVSRIYTVL